MNTTQEATKVDPTIDAKKKKITAPNKSEMALVIYTDGGAKPSRGPGGYGLHGYWYTAEKPKQGHGAKAIPTKVGYIEPSIQKRLLSLSPDDFKEDAIGGLDLDVHQSQAIGPGDVESVTVHEYVDLWVSHSSITTNNVMELTAAIEALEYALEHKATRLDLYVDSNYVRDGLNEWVAGWQANNWMKSNGEPIKNREHWERFMNAKAAMEREGQGLEIHWVRGHNGNLGNEIVDEWATRGVILAQQGTDERVFLESPAKGYWSLKPEHNRMLSKSCYYFTTNASTSQDKQDGRYVYHLGKHGPKDDWFGKPQSDTSYSVVYTKEPIRPLESIRAFRDKIDRDNNDITQRVVIARLDTIHQPKVFQHLLQYGHQYLHVQGRDGDTIALADGSVLAETQRPTQLAFRGVQALLQLEDILRSYLTAKQGGSSTYQVVVTDVTDQLYMVETTKSGKTKTKLRSEIEQTQRSLTLSVNYDTLTQQGQCDVTLLFDLDLPSRNALSGLDVCTPSVFIVTWRESDTSFRFATVVETEDDVGIWSSYYSNLRLLTDPN